MWQVNGLTFNLTDNQKSQVLIDTCTQLGYDIPRFCYSEDLKIVGNCRMCLIEDSKSPKPIICCAGNASKDLNIFTNTLQVKKARESMMEFLLINHPLDCPICDQGGECDSQDLALVYGSDRGRFYDYKRNVEDKNCGPVIKTIMNRCILCTRCVRFATDIAGFSSFGLTGRGNKMEIGSYIEKIVDSELSGNIVDICPVGALTSKPYSFVSRPWELKKFNFFNIFDEHVQLLRADLKENEIVRILPSKNSKKLNNWITNRTRFSYEGLNKNRLLTPEVLGIKSDWGFLINIFKSWVTTFFQKNKFTGIFTSNVAISNFSILSNEEISYIKSFVCRVGDWSSFFSSVKQDNLSNYPLAILRPSIGDFSNVGNQNFVLVNVNMEFELPFTSILLSKFLNLNKRSALFNWRSLSSKLLLAYELPVNVGTASLYNFVKGKTWLNSLSGLKSYLYLCKTKVSPIFEKLNFNIKDILVSTLDFEATSRAILNADLSTCKKYTANQVLPVINYSINAPDKTHLTGLNTLRHETHKNSFSSLINQNQFFLPNKDHFEKFGTFFTTSYKLIKCNPIVSSSAKTRTVADVLVLLSKFMNITIGSVVSNINLSLKFLLATSTAFSDMFFKNENINIGLLYNASTYYNETTLFSNSHTLSSIQGGLNNNQLNKNIY